MQKVSIVSSRDSICHLCFQEKIEQLESNVVLILEHMSRVSQTSNPFANYYLS